MKNLLLWAVAITGAAAFPRVANQELTPDALDLDTRALAARSKAEGNCGPNPCTVFNAKEQYRSTTGKHAFQSPAITDIRGPCPGLNAAANHGYIPRSGIMTFESTFQGMWLAYGLSREFNAFLAVYAILMSGDLISMTWSIGGPQPYNSLGGTLTPPQGISYSHNKYEGDVSIARADAYMNNGDAHSLNITRFLRAYEAGMGDNRYTLDKFRGAFVKNVEDSIKYNPYYFSPPFAGLAVPPAAYNFVINFMSNHTKENPSGYLDGQTFKSFFSVVGEYPNFKWQKGMDRIPDNWYARPLNQPYGAATTVEDLVIGWAAYPDGFRVGGNTNGPNSYTGVDLGDLTGGSVNAGNVLKGNNAGCLIFLGAQQAIPDELKGGVNDIAKATKLFKKFAAPIVNKLGCKPLNKYDSGLFNAYPGYHYNPTGKATNY